VLLDVRKRGKLWRAFFLGWRVIGVLTCSALPVACVAAFLLVLLVPMFMAMCVRGVCGRVVS
jgi:hypothetical protein